jgi:photosystem II stability/assembly factor-like uncharacterized protein
MSRALLVLCLCCCSCLARLPRINYASQNSQTKVSLRGVSVVSPEVCWASGAGGTFVRTIDGGRTWADAVVPGAEQLDFRDVEALDANTALLLSAGRPAQVWRTTDAGLSWQLALDLDFEGVFLDGMDFDGPRGIAWGDPVDGYFVALTTADGGQTWRRIGGSLPVPEPDEAGFAASGTAVALRGGQVWIGTGGSVARVLHTSDAGATWSTATTTIQHGGPSQGIFSLAFVGALSGVAVGGDYASPDTTSGSAAYTRDGGTTWRPAHNQQGYRSCVAVLPIGHPAYLVSMGKTGASISTNAGERWELTHLPGHYALDFAPEPGTDGRAVGYAVGDGGRVTRVEVWR